MPDNYTTFPAAYPVDFLRRPPWHDFTKHNGYIKLASRLHIKVETDIETIGSLWEQFSPKTSLFDLWEIRRAFQDGHRYTCQAITLFEKSPGKNTILGMLPLCYDNDIEFNDIPIAQYKWFGTNWPEDNTFFVKDPEIIPLLLFIAPGPLILDCLRPLPELEFLKTLQGFSLGDKKYYLDLSSFKTVDDFLATMKKKRRYNLKRDRKRIQQFQPVVRYNHAPDIESLFALNIERFRKKFPNNPDEFSTLENDRQKRTFRNLLSVHAPSQVRLITTSIGGTIAAVEMGLVYNRTYYSLCAGTAVDAFSGIGTYSNLLVIEDALRLGCTTIDFLEGDYNWKEHWHLKSLPQYVFAK